jgi:hypothetical protein
MRESGWKVKIWRTHVSPLHVTVSDLRGESETVLDGGNGLQPTRNARDHR